MQVNVPRSFFIERQRDLPAALRTPSRRQVQLFSNPAVEADVKAVNFSSDDVKELRACRPNECNFKLPATTMDAVRAVDLSAPGAPDRASAFARRQIIDYVTDYRQRGNAAMLVYDDRGSVRSSDALVAMMKDSSYTFAMVPSLANFVVNYPRDPLGDATEAMFWSVDELPHVRPVLRIMHQVVYSPPEIPGMTILAAKQIYANHYFEAGLELLAAVDRVDAGAAAGTKGITLVAVRRYRFDHLPNGGPINVRGRVRGGLQDNVVADLTRLKRDYEAAWRAASDR